MVTNSDKSGGLEDEDFRRENSVRSRLKADSDLQGRSRSIMKTKRCKSGELDKVSTGSAPRTEFCLQVEIAQEESNIKTEGSGEKGCFANHGSGYEVLGSGQAQRFLRVRPRAQSTNGNRCATHR